jgi:hypothetical protein
MGLLVESVCIYSDILPPTFLRGECPDDMQVYIDSSNNTATVTWKVPTGTDNSKEQVIIKEEHDYVPGQRFNAGSYVVKYSIEDQEHNKGDYCNFRIEVLSKISDMILYIILFRITTY